MARFISDNMGYFVAGGTILGVTLIICFTVLAWKYIDDGGWRN